MFGMTEHRDQMRLRRSMRVDRDLTGGLSR
jgi:hypothetical protein